MKGTLFGLVAVVVGFAMIGLAKGEAAVMLGGIVVIAIGLGFVIYGSGR